MSMFKVGDIVMFTSRGGFGHEGMIEEEFEKDVYIVGVENGFFTILHESELKLKKNEI